MAKSYIKIEVEDFPEFQAQITAKNEEIGKRKYTLEGMFCWLIEQRFNLTVEGVLQTATQEEITNYLNSKVVTHRESKKVQTAKLFLAMEANEKSTIPEDEKTTLRMGFLKRMNELLKPLVTA